LPGLQVKLEHSKADDFFLPQSCHSAPLESGNLSVAFSSSANGIIKRGISLNKSPAFSGLAGEN
jgi:hypothetical protein